MQGTRNGIMSFFHGYDTAFFYAYIDGPFLAEINASTLYGEAVKPNGHKAFGGIDRDNEN